MSPKSKIILLIVLQITVIVTSFLALILLENEKSSLSEIFSYAEKNRFFSAILMHEIMEYSSNPSTLISDLDMYKENLDQLQQVIQKEYMFFPISDEIKTEFSHMMEDYFMIKSDILAHVKTDSMSKFNENILDVKLDDMISDTDVMTDHISNHVKRSSEQMMHFEAFLAVTNVITHILLIIMILKIQKREDQKTNQIKQQLDNYKTALDKSAIVVTTDLQGQITYVNDKFCEISKYTREELLGQNHRMLKSGHHDKAFYENMWKEISQGNVWNGILKNKAKDGTFYWVATSIVPLFDERKEIKQYMAIRQNITKQKEFEEELVEKEKLTVIGQLSARLAHDLRNPLSIIVVSIENLKHTLKVDEFRQTQFDKIERSVDRIVHQVEDVLDYVKEKSKSFEKVNFSEIVSESLDSVIIPDTIRMSLPRKDAVISCDKKQFVVVLNNLILNSIQATKGTGLIAISLEETKDNTIIEIEDSGDEIPKKDLGNLFEPLFTTKQSGMGLGLVSVKSIIEAHGGKISVQSPPTRFTITLPKEFDKV